MLEFDFDIHLSVIMDLFKLQKMEKSLSGVSGGELLKKRISLPKSRLSPFRVDPMLEGKAKNLNRISV